MVREVTSELSEPTHEASGEASMKGLAGFRATVRWAASG